MTIDALLMLLASAAGAALINAISQIIQWTLNRRAKLKDDQKNAKTTNIQQLSDKIATIENGQKMILHDRIKYLARCYMEKGEVDYDDYKDLIEMHKVYCSLGGENLILPMEGVSELPKIYK